MTTTFPRGCEISRRTVLARVRRHRKLDQIVSGCYWQGNKGCALGCSWHGNSQSECVTIAAGHGFPPEVSGLEDSIFEGLARTCAPEHLNFPLAVIRAAGEGKDLSMVWPRFALWLLSEDGSPITAKERAQAVVVNVADLFREWIETGNKPSRNRFDVAAGAARAARAAGAAWAAEAAEAARAARAARAAWAARAAGWRVMRDKLITLIEESPHATDG